ncbi:MAG: helix-turn-helix domain-containing protein [Muribaculaceae bacterium]
MARFKDVHKISIGQIIKHRLDKSGISYTRFAELIHVSRPTLYAILSGKSIDIDRLILISEILDYDFIGNVYYNTQPSTNNSVDIVIDDKMLCNNTLSLNLDFSKITASTGVNNTDKSVNISDSEHDSE